MSNLTNEIIAETAARILPVARKVSKLLGPNDSPRAFIGGFPRDHILGLVTRKKAHPKDIDILLKSKPTDLRFNKSVRRMCTNVWGGDKFYLDGVGRVDTWGRYTSDVGVVLQTIDFNCNMVAYLWPENKIIVTPEFDDFINTKTIRLGPGVEKDAPEIIAIRALRFQTKFKLAFGFEAELDGPVLDKIKNLTPAEEKRLLEYFEDKINSGILAAKILERMK